MHGEQRIAEVAVDIAASAVPGGTRPVTVIAQSTAGHWEGPGQITVAEPGWTMWMVSHFHYDPVWWNTQGRFAADLAAAAGRRRLDARGQDGVRAGQAAPGGSQVRP